MNMFGVLRRTSCCVVHVGPVGPVGQLGSLTVALSIEANWMVMDSPSVALDQYGANYYW